MSNKSMSLFEGVDLDCLDPRTGCYLAFTGYMTTTCACCGFQNILHVTVPTNRFQFLCSSCGDEYETQETLVPLSQQ